MPPFTPIGARNLTDTTIRLKKPHLTLREVLRSELHCKKQRYFTVLLPRRANNFFRMTSRWPSNHSNRSKLIVDRKTKLNRTRVSTPEHSISREIVFIARFMVEIRTTGSNVDECFLGRWNSTIFRFSIVNKPACYSLVQRSKVYSIALFSHDLTWNRADEGRHELGLLRWIRSFVCSFVRLFIRSFVRLFVLSFSRVCTLVFLIYRSVAQPRSTEPIATPKHRSRRRRASWFDLPSAIACFFNCLPLSKSMSNGVYETVICRFFFRARLLHGSLHIASNASFVTENPFGTRERLNTR